MSPEQARGEGDKVGPAGDTYSLGATLYAVLTGQAPVTGRDSLEVLDKVRRGDFPRPRSVRRRVPAALEAVCLKAMAPEPEGRYPSARALADDVERWLADEPVRAYREPLRLRLGRWARRRKPLVAGVASAVLLTVLLGGAASTWLAAQRAETARAVNADFEEAELLLRQAQWRDVEKVLERAEGRMGGGGPQVLRQRLQQLRNDLGMVAALEGIPVLQTAVMKGDGFDLQRTDSDYRKAFADYGLEVEKMDPDEAAARIRESAIREQLVAALDDWVTQKPLTDKAAREQLLLVVGQVDPDPWRRQLREAWVRGDVPALERLAARAPVDSLPRSTLVILGRGLVHVGSIRALPLLQAAQRLYPDEFWFNDILAVALLRTGPTRVAEAVGFFRAALALRPQSPGAHVNLGDALRRQKQLAEAEAALRTAIRLQPGYAMAHLNLSLVLSEKGDLDGAVAALREGIHLKPGYGPAYYNLGLYLDQQGRLDEAVAACREAIRLEPNDAKAHYNLGIVLKKQNRLEEASAAYRAAIRAKPNHAEAHCNLASTLQALGRPEEALTCYREAIRVKKDLAEAHYGLGNLFLKQRKFPEALAAYREAVRVKPDFAMAHCNLGYTLQQQGQRAEAERAYREALVHDPDLYQGYLNLGTLLQEQGRLPEAEACYREAIYLRPEEADARANLGFNLQQRGEWAEAEEVYREAIHFRPDNVKTYLNLGVVLRQQGKLPQAIDVYREAVCREPDYTTAHFNLGNALRQQGKLPQAAAAYRAAIRLQPDLAGAHCNLGLVLSRQGQYHAALAALRHGHELGMRSPGWSAPSDKWVRETEQLVQSDDLLALILRGKAEPVDAAERAVLARFCLEHKRLFVTSARLYDRAFTDQPRLAADLRAGHRYNAARAAALAGCGRGEDAAKQGDEERQRWRAQARDWLRAELAWWTKYLEQGPSQTRAAVAKTMSHWQTDPDLAGLRDPAALANLPDAERTAWQKLWADVETLRRRAAESR
jgi:tetratricopeptide (TPR) repeat protein